MSHIKGPRNLLAIGILIILVFFGLTSGPVTSSTASADAQRMISLYADGQKRIFGTDAHTVGQVLGRAGIKLGLHDLVEPAAGTPIGPGQFNINVYRAHPVLVQDGYQSHYATSAYDSARLIAKDAGLDLYPEDTLQTGVITNVVTDGAVGVKVVITRAWPFTVHADGKVLQLRTQARTIGAALAGAGVALGPQDTVVPAATAPLTRGLDITITRVSQAEATVTQTLPRPVQTISDPTLLKGKVVVQAAGSDGQKVLRYLIHYRDGV
ncbi:MAG TPA: ubiquitin-like domain-containing protein, partial [Candidatus Saccharimonas sp.]|nr:ubiquitin-like domain-containing protein [Candidatus Saccharimonas sp.]